jgi:hypothetical protein
MAKHRCPKKRHASARYARRRARLDTIGTTTLASDDLSQIGTAFAGEDRCFLATRAVLSSRDFGADHNLIYALTMQLLLYSPTAQSLPLAAAYHAASAYQEVWSQGAPQAGGRGAACDVDVRTKSCSATGAHLKRPSPVVVAAKESARLDVDLSFNRRRLSSFVLPLVR